MINVELIVSGKRASGKTTIIEICRKALEEQGLKVSSRVVLKDEGIITEKVEIKGTLPKSP